MTIKLGQAVVETPNSASFLGLNLRLDNLLLLLLGSSVWVEGGGGWSNGPRPTRISPAVREEGAKGPRRKERENQMKRDWRGSMVK